MRRMLLVLPNSIVRLRRVIGRWVNQVYSSDTVRKPNTTVRSRMWQLVAVGSDISFMTQWSGLNSPESHEREGTIFLCFSLLVRSSQSMFNLGSKLPRVLWSWSHVWEVFFVLCFLPSIDLENSVINRKKGTVNWSCIIAISNFGI